MATAMEPNLIQRLRHDLGMSQAELAEAVGVSRVAVTHWESGNRRPSGPAEMLLNQLVGRTKNKSGKKTQKPS